MTDPVPSPDQIAREISRVLAENPQALADIGGNEQIQRTLQNITELDRSFQERGGVFFHSGSNAFETAERFTQIHVEQYRETGRPSLPALAVHHAEALGLDKGSAEYKAMLMVAVRAEMETSVKPDYHSKNHYLDVAAMTANLLEKNNDMVAQGKGIAMTKQDQALAFIAAIGHDLDHEGKSNPSTDPLFNEKKSFAIMEPLLKDAGLSPQQIADARTILMTTSPNGPHAMLKTMAKGIRDGEPITIEGIQELDRAFNEKLGKTAGNLGLQQLDFSEDLGRLNNNPKLIQMAAMVSDADLYASGGAGMKANEVMSRLLTDEGAKYNNSKLDFTTDGSRKFFLDGIVGQEGFASDAGRETANEMFKAMRTETEQRLAAAAEAKKAAAAKKNDDGNGGPKTGGGDDGNGSGPKSGGGNDGGVTPKAPATPPPAMPPTENSGDAGPRTTAPDGSDKGPVSKFIGEQKPGGSAPKPGVANASGAALGIGMGVVGLVDAVESGDKVGAGLATANIASGTAEAVIAATGKGLTTTGKFIPGVNIALTVADGVYQVSKEDTTEKKVERAAVVTATAGTGLALGAAASTPAVAAGVGTTVTALGGGAATVTAATVAAPVVLTAAAVVAVGYTGNAALESKRAWDNVDKQIEENGRPQRREGYKSQDGKPSVLAYKHIAAAILHHSEHMKNENMNGAAGIERDPRGRFKIGDFKKIDMHDPKNIAELERVLKQEIEKQEKIIKANDSFVPKGLRIFSGDSVDKMTMAQMERADMAGALAEIQMYKKELADYNAANPGDPATTGAKPPAATAASRPKTRGPGMG
jgi:hypothetical protein